MDIGLEHLPTIAEKYCPRTLPFTPCKAYIFSFGPEWFDSIEKSRVELDDSNFSNLGQKLQSVLKGGFLERMTTANLDELWGGGGYSQSLEAASKKSNNTYIDNAYIQKLKGMSGKVVGLVGHRAISFLTMSDRPGEEIGIFFSSDNDPVRAAKAVEGQFPDTFAFFMSDPLDDRLTFPSPIPYKKPAYTVNDSMLNIHFDHLLQLELAELRKKAPTTGARFFELDKSNTDINRSPVAQIGTPKELAQGLPKGPSSISENTLEINGQIFAFDSALTANAVAKLL